jgi:hypothetical protein
MGGSGGRRRAGWAALGAALVLGCGGGEGELRGARPLAEARPEAHWENSAPRIEEVRLDPAEPLPGLPVRAVVRASDPDGDALRLAYAWSLAGRRLPADGAGVTLAGARKGDLLEVAVTASDGEAHSETARAQGRVANRRPRLLSLELAPRDEIPAGGEVLASARGEDPDGDRLDFEYRWRVNGEPVPGSGPRFAAAGLARGDRVEVEVVAHDGEATSDALRGPVQRVANAPPRITSSPPAQLREGEFVYTVEAEDPDGDRGLRYRLLEGPPGMTLDGVRGELRWRPAATQTGVHVVDLAVQDPAGAATAQRFQVTLRAKSGEELPAASE